LSRSPFCFSRLQETNSSTEGEQREKDYYVKNNVMITTSGNCSTEALICALLAVGADHILFRQIIPMHRLMA